MSSSFTTADLDILSLLPLDALARILVLLHPDTLDTLAATCTRLHTKTRQLQDANWFAVEHVIHIIADIEAQLAHLDATQQVDADAPFVTAWQHAFAARLGALRLQRRAPTYARALLKTRGFGARQLQMLGDNLGGAATAALVRWRSGGFASAPSVLAAVRSLLEDAPWIEASCDVGLLLVWASAVGALDIVQAIAANPAHWNKAENTHALAMIASAGLGHLNILEYLIKERNINPAASHNSALEWAAKSGQLEIVNFLLADSRVDPKDASSMAFVWACKSGHLEIVERLLEDGRSDPTDQNHGALICAARFGYTDIVARLLQDERVNVNAQEGHVLISPSVNGHGQTLEVLLNAGADLSLTQYRPFHLALQAGNAKIIRVFLRNTTGWADNVWMCMHILLQAPRRKYSLAEFLSIFM